ncbi:MAG: hypothetical protein JHC95_00015 [Solirubrobacteraceae bacterium]|nr:hypothetical protein [Solirubrobacteraceae bacterium]
MLRRCLVLTPLALLAIAPAAGHATSVAATAPDPFMTPSKQIRCAWVPGSKSTQPGFIRCDALFLNDTGFLLDRKGKGKRIHVTDTIADPEAPVLAYGKTYKHGQYRCTSRQSGLTCERGKSGHGFFISRQRQRVY